MGNKDNHLSQSLIDMLRRDGYVVLPACASADIVNVMAPLCFQAPNGNWETAKKDAQEAYSAIIDVASL